MIRNETKKRMDAERMIPEQKDTEMILNMGREDVEKNALAVG